MTTKRLISVVVVLHSLCIGYVLWSDVTTKGEDWSWALAFFLDFPISVGFYRLLDLVRRSYSLAPNAFVAVQTATHLVVGGLWWTLLVMLVRGAVRRLRGREAGADRRADG
jgi:hypothetical protein